MKKLILLLLSLLIIGLPCFAEYKPIPKELSKQYKKEMESIIDRNYPIVIKKIDALEIEALNYYEKMQENGYDIGLHVSMVNIAELRIQSADIELYSELTKITKEKYLGQAFLPQNTDSVIPLEDFLFPYLKNNKVNVQKLKFIIEYQKNKSILIQEYLKKIQKLVSASY